jgi:hypothetical protein
VTGTAGDTVSGVNQATGGALGATGVTQAAEDAVSGAAGPESTAGQTVDKTTESVGGVIGRTTETVGGLVGTTTESVGGALEGGR